MGQYKEISAQLLFGRLDPALMCFFLSKMRKNHANVSGSACRSRKSHVPDTPVLVDTTQLGSYKVLRDHVIYVLCCHWLVYVASVLCCDWLVCIT